MILIGKPWNPKGKLVFDDTKQQKHVEESKQDVIGDKSGKDTFKFRNHFWFRGDGKDPWAPGNLLWKHYADHKSIMLEREFH